MKLRLNMKKWNESRLELEANISKLKEALHTPGHNGSATEWLTLFDLQKIATTLYMLRAETRGEGRLHCTHEVVYRTTGHGTPMHPHVTQKLVVPVTREMQRERIAAYLPGENPVLDEHGECGYFSVCPEKPETASVTVPA